MYTVKLTEDEVADRAQAMAQVGKKLIELDEREEGVKAEYKRTMADIKEQRLERSLEFKKLMRAVSLKVEERDGQQPLFDDYKVRTEVLLDDMDKLIEEHEAETDRAGEQIESVIEADAVQDPCVCGHDYAQHFKNDVECEICDCKAFQERLVAVNRCPECDTKDGHQASCSQYEINAGTPFECERTEEEFEMAVEARQRANAINVGKPVKLIHLDGAPLVVTHVDNKTETATAWHVLPLENCQGRELRDKSQPIINKDNDMVEIDYTNVKVNCGSTKRPDYWVMVGPKVVLSVRADNVAKQPLADNFTADRCNECQRIDGAHSDTCSHRSMISYSTYLAFAKAMKLKNPASHARKMELSRDRDEEVAAWVLAEQGTPNAEKGELFNAEPEAKPKRRGKLQLVTETSYEAGL